MVCSLRKNICVLLLFVSFMASAQLENTLYYMDRLPQSQYLNPAEHPDCKWWLTGLVIPVWTIPMLDPPIVHFPMYFDASVPFSLSDFVIYKNGKPSYTSGLDTTTQKAFLKKLHSVNNITSHLSIEVLNFGFKQGKNYWDFSYNIKSNLDFSFPKELFAFTLLGNEDRPNGDFSGLAINYMLYHEIALGLNHQFSRYFRVGVRVKLLLGLADINTSQATLSAIKRGDSNGFDSIELKANYLIRASVPGLNVTTNPDGSIKNITDTAKAKNIIQQLYKTRNKGMAIDFGLMKDWNSELTLFASVVDFGFITWAENVHEDSLKGSYIYKGIPVTVNGTNIDSLSNQLKNSYKLSSPSQIKYTTRLNTNFYFGGNYKLTKKIAVGIIERIQRYAYPVVNYEYSTTASLNVKPFRWGALTLSYSYYKQSFSNIGLGYTVRVGAVQWFAVYDNLIGAAILPENARYWSMRWGVNLVFGRGNKLKKDKNPPILNTILSDM